MLDLTLPSPYQCSYDEIPPPHNAAGKHINDKSDINPAADRHKWKKNIRVGLLKLLFKAIGTDNAKKLSDKVIGIIRHGISRGN